jgi:hypothetical protein
MQIYYPIKLISNALAICPSLRRGVFAFSEFLASISGLEPGIGERQAVLAFFPLPVQGQALCACWCHAHGTGRSIGVGHAHLPRSRGKASIK